MKSVLSETFLPPNFYDVHFDANDLSVEIQGTATFDANGGIQDIWGIYKQPNSPWVFASDRNGGLYVLKEYGAGSAKKGKK